MEYANTYEYLGCGEVNFQCVCDIDIMFDMFPLKLNN